MEATQPIRVTKANQARQRRTVRQKCRLAGRIAGERWLFRAKLALIILIPAWVITVAVVAYYLAQ